MRFDQENEQPLEKTSMSEWYAFRESLDSFTDDIFAEGRNQERKSKETIWTNQQYITEFI